MATQVMYDSQVEHRVPDFKSKPQRRFWFFWGRWCYVFHPMGGGVRWWEPVT